MQHANPEGLLSDKENYKGPPRRNYLKAATFVLKYSAFLFILCGYCLGLLLNLVLY